MATSARMTWYWPVANYEQESDILSRVLVDLMGAVPEPSTYYIYLHPLYIYKIVLYVSGYIRSNI